MIDAVHDVLIYIHFRYCDSSKLSTVAICLYIICKNFQVGLLDIFLNNPGLLSNNYFFFTGEPIFNILSIWNAVPV